MELKIPEDIAKALGENPDQEALEAILLHLIRSGRVSVAWAGKKLGLDRWDSIDWYTARGYPYPDYTEEDIEEDIRNSLQHSNQIGNESG